MAKSSFAQAIKAKHETQLFEPHPYQHEGIKWLLQKTFSGLFLAPGLGKTAMVLAAFRILKHKRMVDKMLVVAPLRVCHLVWPAEIEKWSQFEEFSIGVLHGNKKDEVLQEDHDIYVVNPDGLRWLSRRLARKEFAFKGNWMLIADESSNFKNSRSGRFKIIKSMLDHFVRRVILTGTPAPNGLENLWSQIFILDRGKRLGGYITHFRNLYFYPAGYMGYQYRLQEGGEQKIYKSIDDIVMHKSNDELDLPEKIDNFIRVELPPAVMKQYRDMRDDFVLQTEDEVLSAVNAAVMTGKLKQIANGGIYNQAHETIHLHDEKTAVVEELAEELGGRPLLVMYEFLHDLARLQRAFPDAPRLGGGTKPMDAKRTVARWNAGDLPVMLLHPASAGHGLNLQGGNCHDIVWYSIPFDLELYEQANARVHRQGVKNQVTIHHIVARGTIDARVVRVLHSKDKVQQALLDHLTR